MIDLVNIGLRISIISSPLFLFWITSLRETPHSIVKSLMTTYGTVSSNRLSGRISIQDIVNSSAIISYHEYLLSSYYTRKLKLCCGLNILLQCNMSHLGYLREFWTHMVRPYLNIKDRQIITILSHFHHSLEVQAPRFMKDLYEIYGKNIEHLWQCVERWNISSTYLTSGISDVKENKVHISWRIQEEINFPLVYIRYYFWRKDGKFKYRWRLEYSSSVLFEIESLESRGDDFVLRLLSKEADDFWTEINLLRAGETIKRGGGAVGISASWRVANRVLLTNLPKEWQNVNYKEILVQPYS